MSEIASGRGSAFSISAGALFAISIGLPPAGARTQCHTILNSLSSSIFCQHILNERHMTKRGHPTFQPTDKQRGQVEAMARYGIPQDEIARAIQISRPTLLKYFAEEIETGATKANAQVGEFLFSTIIGAQIPGRPPVTDDRARVTAAIFWAKTRMNWKETSIHKHTGTEGEPIKIDARATLSDAIARIVASAATLQSDPEVDAGTG